MKVSNSAVTALMALVSSASGLPQTPQTTLTFDGQFPKFGKIQVPICAISTPYFKSTGSPTLSLCIDIACQPGQTPEWYERAVYQCYALEAAARRNNNGTLPSGW